MMESRVVGVGRRRSRSEADRLVSEFEQSGMTRKAFCVERGISAHTLDYYRRKSRSGAQVAPQLLPVALVGTSPRGLSHGSLLRVELANGRRIVVEEGFDTSLLRRVIAALEA